MRFSTINKNIGKSVIRHFSSSIKPSLKSIAYSNREGSIIVNFETISHNEKDHVVDIKLNRPTKGNSFNLQMWLDLQSMFEHVSLF
jgi:hypothetical protein